MSLLTVASVNIAGRGEMQVNLDSFAFGPLSHEVAAMNSPVPFDSVSPTSKPRLDARKSE